jgi:hypothetical protein
MNQGSMKWIRITIAVFFWQYVSAQAVHIPAGNAYIMSGAYSRDFLDAFSFKVNPACLGSIRNSTIGLLAERKWMLKELDNYSVSASVSAGRAGIGMCLQSSGDEYYNEHSAQLGYGKKLGRLELGTRFEYIVSQSPGYGSEGIGSAGVGIRYAVSENLVTGWEIILPVFGTAGKTNAEKGPQIFRMGFGYQSGADLLLAFQIEKVADLPVSLTVSVDYKYNDQLFFSFGIHGPSGSPSFKSGWKKNQICIETYIIYDSVLGFTPGLLLQWTAKNK